MSANPYDRIDDDLQRVRRALAAIGEGDNPILVQTIRHLFGARGKFIRPALCLLVGQAFYPQAEEVLINFAAAMEVVHVASLVHDDTLDEANTRRGRTTINAGWNGHIAILVGDYLLAQAAIITAELGDLRIMSMLATTIKALVRGELRQMETSFDWDQSEADYLEKISNKTASLLATCTEGSALLSGATVVQQRALYTYGHKLGLAFQIVDDILDVTQSDEELGKPAGNDLSQGTITLPVIYYLQTATPHERQMVQDSTRLRESVAAISQAPAIERARRRADSLVEEALAALEVLPAGDARAALQEMAHFVVQRTH